ncbi:MAG: DUF4129 domain-containing protein [Burkholderiales bacterium]|nr:DUF4129 domain-containing protein [Burkholderiales bacterium]
MIRAWWRPVYGAWFAIVLPVAAGLHLALAAWPWAALLATWWLKPLYDRIVLHVLSRAVFGKPPGTRATLRSLGDVVRKSGLLAALTWRRLDLARSFNLPVYQLEGQRSTAARSRERVLGRRTAGQATGLLYTCLMFELVLALSLSAGVDLFTPAGIRTDYGPQSFFRNLLSADAQNGAVYLYNAFAVLAISAVEPLYVAGGFALYLNRRTLLEAWDLELSFRRIGIDAASKHARAAVYFACAAAIVAMACAPRPLLAQDASKQIIREVLAAPEFQEYRTQWTWRARDPEGAQPERAAPAWLARTLEALAASASQLTRLAAYGVIAAVLVLALRYLWRELARRQPAGRSRDRRRAPPEVLFGLDVRPEALPRDLAAAAAAAARTDPRMALSLLYRGALATLIHRDRLAIEGGATEADCLRRVESACSNERVEYFARLVRCWSQIAYGSRALDPALVQRLCVEWPRHFVQSAALA